jgi:hypothetical protein
MKTILLGSVLIGCVLLISRLLYGQFYLRRRIWMLASQKYKVVQPLIDKLATHEPVPEETIRTLAMNPSFRCGLFHMLEATNSGLLFPLEYYSHEKGAEAYLVNWLEYPTELGAAPVQIVLHSKITLHDQQPLDYFVFKYKAASLPERIHSDWMFGVSGPYSKTSLPFDMPRRVFSRFNSIGSITAREEVEWVHKNIDQG